MNDYSSGMPCLICFDNLVTWRNELPKNKAKTLTVTLACCPSHQRVTHSKPHRNKNSFFSELISICWFFQVNGIDLSQATHLQARQALKQLYPICRLAVYREKSDDAAGLAEKEGLFSQTLLHVARANHKA